VAELRSRRRPVTSKFLFFSLNFLSSGLFFFLRGAARCKDWKHELPILPKGPEKLFFTSPLSTPFPLLMLPFTLSFQNLVDHAGPSSMISLFLLNQGVAVSCSFSDFFFFFFFFFFGVVFVAFPKGLFFPSWSPPFSR